MKRKACEDSKGFNFLEEVEDIWEDLVESLTKRTWGITKNKRDKNYGKWKTSTNVCKAGSYKDP
jgi:5-methylcytosine-specific restriction endonuclease McrBC regulatory subunit McrC